MFIEMKLKYPIPLIELHCNAWLFGCDKINSICNANPPYFPFAQNIKLQEI